MKYLENRELSWLKFNERVIDEASDINNPLLERLSFSAIYQSNLDEFFMVRVGTITDNEKENNKKKDKLSGMKPSQQLDAVFERVREMQKTVEKAFGDNMSALTKYGYEQVTFDTATEEEQKFLDLYFKREIKPFITGIIVNDLLPFPFLKNKEIYAAVKISVKKGVCVGIIPVAHDHAERIIPLGKDGKRFILHEDLVLKFAHTMFKGCKILDRTLVRVTRNADIMVDNKGADFRDRMEELVAKRNKLAAVRLETFGKFDREALEYICKKLKIKTDRVFASRIPLDLSYLYRLQELDMSPELHFEKRMPRKSAMLAENRPVFPQIKAKDILLSYPFESMTSSFIRLLEESASDPKVISIKVTLYRLARNSKVISALCTAAENGKEVIVMIELRARFDEANNIEWSKVLQRAGVTVIYGPKEYKAHSKLLLIKRRGTGDKVDYVTQIGTGNYNEKTASIYTDLMLLTADPVIAHDAEQVFNCLIGGTFVQSAEKLLVSPYALRPQILEMMNEQIRIAQDGGKAYIGAKINSLNDTAVIKKLVEASQAGVRIELIVRGICCLIPQVEGYTENISVRSIVGRFLEHSRIFIFGKDGREQKIYIGSADLMTRNTIHRVEVATPIEDERLKKRIRGMFNTMLADNVKARELTADGTYVRAQRKKDEEPLNSQEYFYEEAYRRLDERAAKQERMKEVRKKKTTAKKTRKSSK